MAAPKSPFAASVAIHTGAALILFSVASVHVEKIPTRKRDVPLVDVAPLRKSLKSPARPPSGGGGGDRSPLPASKGRLPKFAPHQFTPPMVVPEKREAPLLVAPTLLNEPDPALMNVSLPQWGDPLSKSLLLSNGPGKNGGIGSGEDGGVGSRKGPRSGPGSSDGGSYSSRLDTKAPQVIYQVEPEFSEEARRAKHQGSVLLSVEVDTNGRVSNIRVVKSLGLGLDEKAIEAVSRWRFRPAQRNGKPVTVPATIDVNFHLL